jgi:hypothetical protein
MFTPARYIIYQSLNKTQGEDVSKITESLNYYNLSNFESKPFHRRDSSYFNGQSQQSHMKGDNEHSPAFPRTNVDDQSFTIENKPSNANMYQDSQLLSQLLKNHSLDS